MGSGYPGPRVAFCGLVVAPMAMVLAAPPTYGAEAILWHAGVMLLAAGLHDHRRRRSKGHIHRHYVGDPAIGGRSRRGEFLLGLGIAAALIPVCDTLALWHLLGTVGSRIELDLIAARERRVRDRMRDAQIEAAHYARAVRDDTY